MKILIVICKGVLRNNKKEECKFLYEGKWKDADLIQHEKHHLASENKNNHWLGFESCLPFGKFSFRDGKRV